MPFRQLSPRDISRREVEEHLRARAQLETIVSTMAEGVIVVDASGTLTYMNAAALRLHGFQSVEECQEPVVAFDRLFHVRDMEGNAVGVDHWPVSRILRGETFSDVRLRVERVDSGQWFFGSFNGSAVFDAQGKIAQGFVTLRDITAQETAQRAADQARAEAQLLADAVPALISYVGADCRYRLNNRAYEEWFDQPRASFCGQHMREALGEEAWQALAPHIHQLLRTGREVHYEAEVPYKFGGPRWISATYRPHLSASGAVLGFFVHVTDTSDRKRIEQARVESERKFRRLSDANMVGVFVAQLTGEILEANDCFLESVGYLRGELQRGELRADHLTPPQWNDADQRALTSLLRDGSCPPYEKEFRHKSGARIPVLVAPARIDDTSEVICLVVDLSERKEAERKLQQSEARLANAQRIARLGHWEIDWRTKEVQWSEEMYRLFRVHPETFRPTVERYFDMVPIADHPAIERAIDEAIHNRAPYQVDHRIVRADGVVRYVNDQAEVVFNDAGEPVRVLGTTHDITERRRASEERERLLARETFLVERLRKLADVSTHINREQDGNAALKLVLDAARTLIESHLAVVSLTLDENWAQGILHVHLSDKYADWQAYDASPTGAGIYSLVCQHNQPMRLTQDQLEAHPGFRSFSDQQGRHPPLRGWLAAPLVARDGTNMGLIQLSDKAAGDFTADDEAILVQLAQMASVAVENSRLYQQLLDDDRRKDDFLATLAHELRNPLAPIRNAVQVMQLKGPHDSEMDWSRSVIVRQIEHLTRLIDDLLDISRITRNKLVLRKERVELAEVIRAAVETSQPLIESREHQLAITLPGKPVYLQADLVRLTQVFMNLLTNAAKYTDPRGRISLIAERQGDEVVIRVEDTGIGIAPGHLKTIFEMFSQVEPALDRSQGGLGIGLALVRGLVEMHGGTISAHSPGLGRGSAFTVQLPILNDPPAPPTLAMNTPEAAPHSKLRVLVVDDNRDSADTLAMMLRILGHESHTAYDGQDAVDRAAALNPDAVLLDIGMPRLNGYEAAERIRQQPGGKEVLLLALTGWGQDEDRERTHAAGFDSHLVKPVNHEELNKLLSDHAGKRAAP